MSKSVVSPKQSIWQRDLYESKAFRFVFAWFVCVPWLLVMFVSAAAIVGVVNTTLVFVAIFASVWLYDWRTANPALTVEQRLAEAELAKWQVYYAFGDYWYLRGYFITLVLDIKEPVEGPWYDRDVVRQFISLWESEWMVYSLYARLHQVGRKANVDWERIARLHAIAGKVGRTFDTCSHSAREAEIIRSFFEEVTKALLSLDRWFAENEWPENFQPIDIWDEFNDVTLEGALEGAPFLR